MKPQALEKFWGEAPGRVLVLAPHPDDFDAIGVSLRRLHNRGCFIHLAVLAGAASGVEAQDCPGTAADRAARREHEQRDSCRFFGLPAAGLRFLYLPEDGSGHLEDSPANTRRILEVIEDTAPDLVFMPHGNDTNACHQRCWRMVDRLRPQLGPNLRILLARDPKTISCRLDIFTGFGDEDAAWKRKLLGFHRTQQERNRRRRGYGLDERILRENRRIATELGLTQPYAEAFELE